MNRSVVAQRVRAQLVKFSGIFSPRFTKPQSEFIGEMIYGIGASQDVKLSRIARALDEPIAAKKSSTYLDVLALASAKS